MQRAVLLSDKNASSDVTFWILFNLFVCIPMAFLAGVMLGLGSDASVLLSFVLFFFLGLFLIICQVSYSRWLYNIYDNANRIGDTVFSPGWVVFFSLLPGGLFDCFFMYELRGVFEKELTSRNVHFKRVPSSALLFYVIASILLFTGYGSVLYLLTPILQVAIIRRLKDQEHLLVQLWNRQPQERTNRSHPYSSYNEDRDVRFRGNGSPDNLVEIERFYDYYSFEDPSRAYDIWMDMPTRAKDFIRQNDPEAADVMEQADNELEQIDEQRYGNWH